jgi:uncharacterized protein YeaO (DUF488 family)
MKIKIKWVYEPPDDSDGCRILVDRLWPRGVSKEMARIDFWPKGIAPSTKLRQWYGHDPKKWPKFKTRYFAELKKNQELIDEIHEYARKENVTFVYSSTEKELNNAVALKIYIESLTR